MSLLAWWRARGARACARGRHAWQPTLPNVEEMGTGTAFAVNLMLTFLYAFFVCTRCGKRVARAIPPE